MSKTFRYGAFAPGGRSVHGMLTAASQKDALRLIHERGFQPFDAWEVKDAGASRGSVWSFLRLSRALRPAEKVSFTRDLATLLRADIGVDQALRILLAGTDRARPKAILAELVDALAAGKSLSAALAAGDTGFAVDELAIIRAGEHAGALASVVEHLAGLLARRLDMRQRVVSALIYPGLLIVMSIGAIVFIVTVLIPNILPMFEGSGAEPPAMISVLAKAGEIAVTQWPLLVLSAFALVLSFMAGWRHPALKRITGDLILRVPVVGSFIRLASRAALARTLATLLKSGVHLQQALAAAADVMPNDTARHEIERAREAILQGKRLSSALDKSTLFDAAAVRLLALGEETNRLSEMLSHIAAESETGLTRALERAMTLLTPVLTLTLGLSIGALIMSVMQAILSINELALR